MLEQIRHQLMAFFKERRQIDQNIEGILISSAAKNIKHTLTTRAKRYRVLESTGSVYEVFSTETVSIFIIRLDNNTCTCFEWQSSGILCGHALAVAIERGDDPQTYAMAFYRFDAFRGTYENPIFAPNVNAATGIKLFVDSTDNLLPLVTRRPLSRPKKLRIRGAREGEGREKHIFRCGRYRNTGHSRKTCREVI